jgi:hypothetical protein
LLRPVKQLGDCASGMVAVTLIDPDHPVLALVTTGDNMRPRGPGLPKQPQRHDPEYWRLRAKNTRALAAETNDVSAKELLADVAASYERLAKLAEQRGKKKPDEES